MTLAFSFKRAWGGFKALTLCFIVNERPICVTYGLYFAQLSILGEGLLSDTNIKYYSGCFGELVVYDPYSTEASLIVKKRDHFTSRHV